jgi:hypothetical protein
MFEKEWFPKAYRLGISWEQFWNMNPRIILRISDGHNERIKERMQLENQMAYQQGKYFVDAIMATVGNMLSTKKSTSYKYPEKPYDLWEDELSDEEKAEKEIQKAILAEKKYMAKAIGRLPETII